MTIAEHVTFDWQGGRVVVRFAGEVDVRTVDHIGALVEEMVGCATDGPVLLDMSAATFMDAAGRGLIVAICRRTDGLGPPMITGANPTIRRVLSTTGMVRMDDIQDRAGNERSTPAKPLRSRQTCAGSTGDPDVT